ncbi:unnamed protein product [Orchesella dallaii]|uniref:Uncharacterized protein n=1 Tax=Orchesella dallaii TaxID=48710 RepID=A0ABP1RIA3_9HEXA
MTFLNYFIYKPPKFSLPYRWYKTWIVRRKWAVAWSPILRKIFESGIYGVWERNYETAQRIKYLLKASSTWNTGKVLYHDMKSPYKTKNFFMWTQSSDENKVDGNAIEPIGIVILGSVFRLLGLTGIFTRPQVSLEFVEEYLTDHKTHFPIILDDIGSSKTLLGRYLMKAYDVAECVETNNCRLKHSSFRKIHSKYSPSNCIVQVLLYNAKHYELSYRFYTIVALERPHFAVLIGQNGIIQDLYQERSDEYEDFRYRARRKRLTGISSIPIFLFMAKAHSLYLETFPYNDFFGISKSQVSTLQDLNRVWKTFNSKFSRETGFKLQTDNWNLFHHSKNPDACRNNNYRHALAPLLCLHITFGKLFNYTFSFIDKEIYGLGFFDDVTFSYYRLYDIKRDEIRIHEITSEYTTLFPGDFSQEYSYVLYVKRKGLGKGLWVFASPFDETTWIFGGSIFLLLSLLFTAPNLYHQKKILRVGPDFLRNVFVVLLTVLQQPSLNLYEKNYTRKTYRIVNPALIIWLLGIFILQQFYTGSLFSFLTTEVPPVKNLDFLHLHNSSTILCASGVGNIIKKSQLHEWANALAMLGEQKLQNQKQNGYHNIVRKIHYCREEILSSLPERIAAHEQILTPQGTIPVSGEIAIVSSPKERNLIEESMTFLNYFKYKPPKFSLPCRWYKTWIVRRLTAVAWSPILRKIFESGIYEDWESNYEIALRIKYNNNNKVLFKCLQTSDTIVFAFHALTPYRELLLNVNSKVV